MRRTLVGLLAVVLILTMVAPSFAQDDNITLVPFNEPDLGISGVVPDGWTKIQPGAYLRGASEVDVTVLLYASQDGTLDDALPNLLPSLGLTELPESAGMVETDVFIWTLYRIDVQAIGGALAVDLALNESEDAVNMVILQTSPEDYDALHESVFLPAVEAVAPAEAAPMVELPYIEEEVSFENGDITLAGTLTLPETEGQHPAVVLISGSGPQDRDESLLPLAEIKPFELIADDLTRNGIAVLRYDDRGNGDSTGDFYAATSFDFATDAEAAIDYLLTRDDINPDQIGILGHSEGGLIAAILGARNPNIAFIVSMAGTAVTGREVMEVQNRLVLETSGTDPAVIEEMNTRAQPLFDAVESRDREAIRQALTDLVTYQFETLPAEQTASISDPEAYINVVVNQQLDFYSVWMPDFLLYNPADDWAKTMVPVLGLFGGKDVQVDDEQNAPALEAALQAAGNTDYQIVIFPNANHLFQEADTGSTEEYGTLDQTFTPDFLPTITDWILARVTVVE